MLNDDLEIYGSCDLAKPNIPPRSRLYHLEPIGISTPYVESLTSYIARLAEAHCLTPNSLLTKIVAPELKQSFIKHSSSRNIGTLFQKSRFINGHGKISYEIAQSLNNLTKHSNLELLTVGRYSSVLSSRKLFKKNKSWCSACYEQWRLSATTVYDPLLWTLADVKVCPYHYQVLRDKCPNCCQSTPWLKGNIRVGYCSNCSCWLGSFAYAHSDLNESRLNRYVWNNASLGKLLSSDIKVTYSMSANNILQSLDKIIKITHNGNISAFAKTFGFPKNTVWMWCKGKSLPELKSLLEICYPINLNLINFLLFKQTVFQSFKIDEKRLDKLSRAKRISPKSLDLDSVENNLRKILRDSGTPPLPMKKVAKGLGFSQRSIERHFPSLCKAISAKYSSYQQEIKKQQIQNCCQEIEQAVIMLNKSGDYPTEALVSELISQPGYFRYKKVRKILKDCILKYCSFN